MPIFAPFATKIRRGARVVEEARLESVYAGNRIESSNLFLSAFIFERTRYSVLLHLGQPLKKLILK